MRRLGIVGGMGPAASVYFYELLTGLTPATSDQGHLDIALLSRPAIPDRTAFILGKSDESPLPPLLETVRELEALHCGCIVVPCVTAHYFYDELQAATPVPILHILRETADFLQKSGVKTAGVMGTEGTLRSGMPQKELTARGIAPVTPTPGEQAAITDVIYSIKAGKPIPIDKFMAAADALRARGAERVMLACTELPLVKKAFSLDDSYVSVLGILAKSCIQFCMEQYENCSAL